MGTFFQESIDGGITWESYTSPFCSNYPGYFGDVESIEITEKGYVLGGTGNRLRVAEIDIASSIESNEASIFDAPDR